jgi:YgiT-type zinc finger domain-containing protein
VYDYGKCEICNTPLGEKTIQQEFWIKDKLVVIEKVPAEKVKEKGSSVCLSSTIGYCMQSLNTSIHNSSFPLHKPPEGPALTASD